MTHLVTTVQNSIGTVRLKVYRQFLVHFLCFCISVAVRIVGNRDIAYELELFISVNYDSQ